jgi:DNA-binding GntR family transcriptional regulator
MAFKTTGSPFGSTTRTEVLVSVGLLGSSFQRELARLLGRSPSVVQKALSGLERDGLVAGRPAGRTRLYEINPRYFARDELLRFLARLAEGNPDLRARVGDLRRRPRRAGKPL